MAMEISNYYNNYANSYTNTANSKKQTEEKTEKTNETANTTNAFRKTAKDELSYLSKKFSGYSFVAGVYQIGTKFGSSNTTNVMIDSRFLEKMANDPELEKEYEKQIAGMQECDEQLCRMQAAKGWHVVAQGWVIDKDGGMSKWSIVQKNDTKSHLETMSENAEKIRKENEEKKKEKIKIQEKRQENKEEQKKLREKLDEAGKKTESRSFDDVVKQKKDLIDTNLSTDLNFSFSFKISESLSDEDRKAAGYNTLSMQGRLTNIAETYASLYDEIVRGYENGTRKINVADSESETGYRTLTMDEELKALDEAYEKAAKTVEELAQQQPKVQKFSVC